MLDLESVLGEHGYKHEGRGTWTHPKGHKVTVGENRKSWLHSADKATDNPMKNGFGGHTLKEHLVKIHRGKVSQHEEEGSEQFSEWRQSGGDHHFNAGHGEYHVEEVTHKHISEADRRKGGKVGSLAGYHVNYKKKGDISRRLTSSGMVSTPSAAKRIAMEHHASQHQEQIASPPPLRAVADSVSAPIQFTEETQYSEDEYSQHGEAGSGYVALHHKGNYIGHVSQLNKRKWKAVYRGSVVTSAAANHHQALEAIKAAHKGS